MVFRVTFEHLGGRMKHGLQEKHHLALKLYFTEDLSSACILKLDLQ